jgi:tetratricopeptide (TPR) repeat protein
MKFLMPLATSSPTPPFIMPFTAPLKSRHVYRALLTATVLASLWGFPLAVQAASTPEKRQPTLTASSSRPTVSEYFNRGIQKVSQGDFTGAIADFSRVIQLQPDFAAAYSNRALAHVQVENYEAALADIDQVLELDPNPEAYNHRGIIQAQMGDTQAAIADFTQALDLAPAYTEALYNRGMAYYTQANYPAAIADFTQALETSPNAASIYGQRGLAHYAMGNRRRATSDLRMAADLFQQQGDRNGYQYTQTLLNQVQP